MACTYTLIDANGKQITLNGPAEFKAYLVESGLKQFYPDGKYPWSPKEAAIEPSAQIDFKASQAFADRLMNGESFKTIVQARKALTTQVIDPGTELAKKADEAIELAGVLAARRIVNQGMSESDTFDALVKIADQMPSLNVRTSESIAQQAYSTPLPLAYVASVRSGITKQTTVIEPTAGNGALVMAANPKLTMVNELNKSRAESLKEQGFDVTTNDAVKHDFGNRDANVVIANPPFGVVKDDDNKTITFNISGGYNTNEIDHAIALNALKAMGENGKAVLIVGGPSKMLSDEKRSDAYNGKAKRSFYFTLYNQYNVTDHFTVSGDLYAKQGAAWPVDVIVIDGVGKSELKLPAANLPRIINSIEELKNELQTNRVSLPKSLVSVEQATRSQTETGDAGSALANKPSADTESNQNRQPSSVLSGLGNNTERNGSNGDNLRQQDNNVAGRPARADTPTDTIENKFQAPYRPGSAVNPVGTLVPVNMQASIETALQRVIDKHGDLDVYVADLLDYKVKDIGKYFSAEQVDAIALALDNIEQGKGFIIGDQTGVGKGRVNAAMIRYAIKNKIIPIFVTEKANLYGDMIRDLTNIGMKDIKPFATNASESIPLDEEASEWYEKSLKAKELGEKPPAKYGKFINTPSSAKQNKAMKDMAEKGKLIDADVIFTTYSQMQTVKGAETDRMSFLNAMGDGALLILDESHNAGGTTAKGRSAEEAGATGRAAMARKLVSIAKGVFYSSATYAKRPDVLDLYSKTDMGLVANLDVLKESLVAGGVALQQSIASMLAKAGQYIRREKSFDGIVYDTVNVNVDKSMAEKSSEVMREIMKFDTLKQSAVKDIKESLKSEAGTITSDKATGAVGADSSNFSSVMHNMIGQMLLILKTKPAIDEAIAALKRGEKPVITLSNTMGSVIGEYAEDMGLNVGDAIDLNVGYLLKRYAKKSRRVTITNAYGEKTTKELSDAELGPLAVRQYNKIINLIDSFDFSNYPISPIDYIHNELEKAGYKSNEITGRNNGIDYSKETPTYKIRSGQDKTPAGKRKIINDFNNGLIDVIILNQSGSTGISLHSSPNAGRDTRKRHMIVAQPELNIDTHMQMLGRVNRTGQLNLPSYAQLAADIPAEKRPSAILAKKMAMLNANTTAGKDSAVKAKDVPDFMNQYGDEIVASIMKDNPDIHKVLGEPLGKDFDKEGAIAKVSGRIPVLSLKEQDVLYQAIEDEYNDYIDMLTKTGENQLEAHAMDLGAKTVSEETVVPAIEGSDSPFAEPVIAKTVDAKKLGKPYTIEQIKSLVEKQQYVDAESRQVFLDKSKAEYQSALAEIDKMDDSDQLAIDRKNSALNTLNYLRNDLNSMFQKFYPRKSVLITSPKGMQYMGIVGKFERKGTGKNYFAQGQWKVTVYVADASKQFVIPLSKLKETSESDTWQIEQENLDNVKKAFEEGLSSTREERVVLTGNMLAAYGFNKTGQIVNYTDDKGEIHQGVLMPKKFNLKQAIEAKPVVFDTPDIAIDFVNDKDIPSRLRGLRTGDNSVRLIIGDYETVLYVPASKSKGGMYFNNNRLTDLLGNFYKRGNEMSVRIQPSEVNEVIRALYSITDSMQPISKEEGKKFFEKKGIKYSKAEQTTGSTVAQIEKLLPNRVKKMVQAGKLEIVQSSSKNTEAYYDTKNDKLVLVADMLNESNLESVLSHELYHRALSTDARTKTAYDKFETQINLQFQLARGGEGSTIEQRAAKRVIDANTPVQNRIEEFTAYLVAEYKNLPTNLKKIIGDFIASIRMTLLRHGLDMGLINTLKPADLYALSKYGANEKAKPIATAKTVSRIEENIPETININGVDRPTRNSNGQLIHQTQESIRNFWKWFGDSKIVDEQGRPVPMYHGTPKQFEKPVFRTSSGALLGKGAYFTSNIKESNQYANKKGESPTVYSVYLKVENPKVTNRFLERVEKERVRDANDGIEFNKPNTSDKWVVTFNPEQIKSLDNLGEFSETNPDIRYSKQFADLQDKAIDAIQNRIKSSKTFNKWHLTVGTQYHKALIDKDFGRVFDASLSFENDTARFANESADQAPSLLPKTEGLQDVAKEVGGKGFKRIKDAKKVADAIFETTLNDSPMTDAELKAEGYSDEQRKMYKEFFAAVNHSLDELAKSELFRLARAMKLNLAPQTFSLRQTANFYTNQLSNQEDKDLFDKKVKQIEKLQSEGYAPLMRFGRFTVDAVNKNTSKREFFGMFETEKEANEMAKVIAEEYPDATVSHGILSQKSWEMFKGVTSETMEAFAKMMNVEQDEAFQLYLAQAVNNRSAMKRLIHRKKIPGFAKDPQRILASFITSNAKATSKNYNMGELVDAISHIPKGKGDVIDEAVDLYNFVQNPSEAGSQVRGLLFAWYLGGSFASAMVNTTQTLTTTLPYLHQFGSTQKVAGILGEAMKLAAKNPKTIGGDLGRALHRAEEEGVTAPHELHMLYGESMRTSLASNAMIRPLQKAWGSLFSLTEGYNRRTAFIAAYNLAKENKNPNPFKFAEDAVNQTQFIYSKSSRPNWARGAVGSTLFTFKTFTINYLEFLKRLPMQERLIALGVLILMSGLSGLPGSDDADDVLDTIGQYLGYNTNTKEWKEKIVNDMLGKEAGQFALHGVSSFLPIDIGSRLSVGNVIPGTAILKKSETDKTRDVMEFAGAAGSLAQKGVQAFEASQGREGVIGKVQAIAHAALPKALSDAYQALDMVQTGYYRDYKGKNVQKVSEADALFKMLGLQPTKVSEPKQRERMVQQDIAMTKAVEADIADLWADGIYAKNQNKVKEAKEMLAEWNRKNPETPIKVKMSQIMKRVKAMKQTSGERLMKTAPKELRKFANESLND